VVGINGFGKTLCVIPARGGSKGVKRKNVRLLKGKPLIGWTIEEARKSKLIDRIAVSTEDAEIARVSGMYGAEVVDRPLYMAQDDTPTTDAVLHTLDVLKDNGYSPEYLVVLQCTSPLRKACHIDDAVMTLAGNSDKADSLISVTRLEHPPWWNKTIDENGLLADFLQYDKTVCRRRQDFRDVYAINGSIYVAKTRVFLEEKSFETKRTVPYVMERVYSIDIDTELDFKMAEFLMEYLGREKDEIRYD